jgi:hypothetical protein
MPKTPVHEHGDARISENKIRPTYQRNVSAPTLDREFAKQCDSKKFRGLISAPSNKRHYLRALGLGINISHCCGTRHIKLRHARVGKKDANN